MFQRHFIFKRLQARILHIFSLIILSSFFGCTSLEQTRIESRQAESANMIQLLEDANKAYSEKKWVEAEQAYRVILNTMEKDEFSHFRLGNTLLRQARLEEAADQFKAALSINSTFSEARHNLSTAYILLAKQQLELMEEQTQEQQRPLLERKIQWLEKAASEPF